MKFAFEFYEAKAYFGGDPCGDHSKLTSPASIMSFGSLTGVTLQVP